MKLIYTESGAAVQKGDKVTSFRGTEATVTGWDEPRHAGSTGRVYVREVELATCDCSYFPGVFKLKFVED